MIDWLIATLHLRYGKVSTRVAAIETLTAMSRPSLWNQLTRALRDDDARVRQAAITALQLRFGTKAIDFLIAALKSDEEIDRLRAADLLVQIGHDVISPLINVLRSTDPIASPGAAYVFRMRAVNVLAQFGQAAISPLIDLLRDDDPGTRNLAARALGGIGGLPTVSALAAVINDSRGLVRQAAIDSLVGVLQYDPHDSIKTKAGELLTQVGSEAVSPLITALVGKVFDPITSPSPSADFRIKAVNVLVQIGQEAISPLSDLLRGHDLSARELAAQALGKIGGPQTVSALAAVLNEATGSLRQVAMSALLRVLQQDKDKSTRIKAVNVLVQIGEEAISPLNDLLRGDDPSTRELAARALGEIGGPMVVILLGTLIKDTREPVRNAATEALGIIGRQVKSENAMERSVAVQALDVIGGSQAVESLVQALEDKDPEVSWEAALALEKNPNRNAIMIQVSALEQTKGDIPGVVYLLGQYGGSEVIDRLQKRVSSIIFHLNSQNPIQRLAAVKALDVVGGSEAIGALVQILNDPDDRVSYAIAKALARRGDAATIEAKLSEWEASDTGKKYKDNEAVNTLVAASAALNSNELRRFTEGKSEETHKNVRAQLETQLNELLKRYAPDSFSG